MSKQSSQRYNALQLNSPLFSGKDFGCLKSSCTLFRCGPNNPFTSLTTHSRRLFEGAAVASLKNFMVNVEHACSTVFSLSISDIIRHFVL